MNAQQLLQEISDYCRSTGLAESTFGRRAVNDGKLTARLRNGGRITTDTLDRIHGFMAAHPPQGPRPIVIERSRETRPSAAPPLQPFAAQPAAAKPPDPQRNFRFFDNRQKYLLFVNTCSEKWEVAHRVSEELAHLHPRPPAVRVLDAGIGDGSVIERAILDKGCRIGANVKIVNQGGVRDAEGDSHVIRDGIVVIPKGALVPDGTVI